MFSGVGGVNFYVFDKIIFSLFFDFWFFISVIMIKSFIYGFVKIIRFEVNK